MFRLELFRIRAFLAGNVASLLAGIGRGGLMFVFVIWLQGIWLPLHGYDFTVTPLWAGIYMLPLTGGFLAAGPISGILSDRYGARLFATAGAALSVVAFLGLKLLPIDFSYLPFALLMAANGVAMGLFTSPNRAAVMNSLPADERGSGSGMAGVFQNSAIVLSMGIFFSLMISGIGAKLPHSLYAGLVAQHVPVKAAAAVSHLPPITSLFASLLGYNPMQQLLGPAVLAHLPHHAATVVAGRTFFPTLLAAPFSDGLTVTFMFGAIACAIAALVSAVPTDGQRALIGRRVLRSDDVTPVVLVPAGSSPTAAAALQTGGGVDGFTGGGPGT
jgi:MFS family permease